MSTPKVPWFPGASCHITARGNHRNDIFKDGEDFQYYLTLIEEALKYFEYDEYEIICYCLMDNHVHILVKTKDKAPGQFIGRVNAMYAKYFNKKYNYIGHLFQDRYHPEFIKSDEQMLEASRYIHLNPIRANMVERPEEYQWSSYGMYIGKKKEKLITTKEVLSYFQKINKRELYKNFVESAIRNKASL
ncbi:transposase [Clostridium carboxidivorans P7]|uniref:Transposase IS200-like domain-containing protein n=1 Tax=Clostridium carboxidivorans P7 TaxID=536227 RepID=C6PXR9_9CLOT|nr:transposase [Clostridium carboxidivorans]AKN33463.1 transposase [Clostridium carboxidivorans P7]EET85950.1 protein of unknown function DUF1568 [Clostridium carboxidivorans P7]